MVEGTDLLVEYRKSEKKAILKGNAEILFRSLDRPNWMRGLELSWFFIDEGRHVTKEAWDILIGRLRQPGFAHAGWVCSTPNGFDWMWSLFHPESPDHWGNARYFPATTFENRTHLPGEYIRDLQANYKGKWFEQEVLGEFVGLMHGAVFPHWNSREYLVEVPHDPDLPLYSFWDYGVGDPGVVIFAQVAHREERTPDGSVYVPELRVLGYLEQKDWAPKEWAAAWRRWLKENVGGRRPDANYGDPAGKQRTSASGTSVVDELAAAGIAVVPARKKPPDYAIRILDTMMAGGRVLVDRNKAPRVGAAIATHRWPTDDAGNRTGNSPVHDWTSHFCDALRYGATALFSPFPRRRPHAPKARPQPGTMGHIVEQILKPEPHKWLGQPAEKRVDWQPPVVLGS